MTKRVTLMLGTAMEGRGGIAAVIQVYRSYGLFGPDVAYLDTHCEGRARDKVKVCIRAFAVLTSKLIRGDIGIVHAHSASGGSFFRKALLLMVSRCFGTRTVFHLHGGSFRKFASEESGVVVKRMIRHTLERSSIVICLSPSWADYCRSIAPRGHYIVLHNPVMLSESMGPVCREAGRILYLGGAARHKGIEELIRAFETVKRSQIGARLALGGSGNLNEIQHEAERSGISSSIEYLGWVSGPDKQKQFERAQIFVLPSHYEGLPMAMLEAMAAGVAVVATTVGGIPELVESEESGLLVPPGDSDSLAAAIVRLLTDDDLRLRLAAAARQRVMKEYSGHQVVNRLREIYAELQDAGPVRA